MKYALCSLAVLSLLSCSKLEDFTVSDCISRNCPYGVSAISYDNKGTLIIDYGTGELCKTKFWGDVEFRNDSLILIARTNFTGAMCRCGYVLTYTIKNIVDTCDLKIGFEKDYADFVKRALLKEKNIKYQRGMSDSEEKKYERKVTWALSRAMYKKPKERREYRSQFIDKEPRPTKSKKPKSNKPKTPIDDAYF
jgi:hypothetical protein